MKSIVDRCWRVSVLALGTIKSGPGLITSAAKPSPPPCPVQLQGPFSTATSRFTQRWLWCCSTPRRFAVYAAVLACAAGWACFFRLGEGTLGGDEAAFALTSERMLESGDWVVPYITDHPHLNATPLYNWLTLLTQPCFDQEPLRYRFWSAAFGVGCILLTLVLGTTLIHPEAGLLAGLLLTTNRYFIHFHGARFGGMDAMISFFITAAVVSYLRVLDGSPRARLWWSLVGGCIGLAWLSKPPVMGAFFFATLIAHDLCTDRNRTLAARLRGPLLALVVAVGVAAPWYLLVTSRLGTVALDQLFLYNSVRRALEHQPQLHYDPFYYLKLLVKSSFGFALIGPALIVAGLRMVAGSQRRKWGLLIVYPLSLFLALSVARRQSFTYLYPTFPISCVLVAWLLLQPWPASPGWLTRPSQVRRAAAWLAGVLAAWVVLHDARLTQGGYASRPIYPPWEVYQRVLPVLDRHQGELVLFGFQQPDLFFFEKLYYERHMPCARWIDRADELQRTLVDGKPTLLLLPQPAAMGSLRERGLTLSPEAQTVAKSGCYAHALLAFHGALDGFALGDLFYATSHYTPIRNRSMGIAHLLP
jgi:4-amino-4-deoxy-L-arabinose transferase-like glycosyltransferase